MDLFDAVIEDNTQAVKQLLEAGINPNSYLDEARVTPLHFAAQHNARCSVELLLAAGADPYARTEPDQQTPFDIARLHQHTTIMNLLTAFRKH